MRSLRVASSAWLVLAGAPFAAYAAGPPQQPPGTAGEVAKVTVAQSQSSTVLPGVTVTAPAPPPMNPWDISTWRFHAGATPAHPEGRHGYGNSVSGGNGAIVASPPR
jgi:hypothetical protein